MARRRWQKYRILSGGKTGTVHKVGEGGYLDDQYVALFVGIAPMTAPRYVTAILIDQPRGDHYGGGLAAAPVYSRVTEEVLRIRNAQPEQTDLGALLASTGSPMTMNVRALLNDASLPDIEISQLVLDSREITPGDAFIAIPGTQQDGRQFISTAFTQGAVAVL